MKKEFLQVISQQVSECYPEIPFGIEPIFINSSLVSAQSRQRYYWTNIPGIKQPEDRGIVLRDILETEPDNFTKMSDKFIKRNGDRNCMIDQNKEKASNLSAMEYVKKGRQGNYLACDDNGKPADKPKQVGIAVDIKGHDQIKRVYSPDGKSNALTTVGKNSVVVEKLPNKSQTIKSQYYKSSRANFERQGTFHATGVQQEDLTWRKLTPLECERLQTVPDDYTNHVSNTQRYKMLGNGWTVEVIKHILKNMDMVNEN